MFEMNITISVLINTHILHFHLLSINQSLNLLLLVAKGAFAAAIKPLVNTSFVVVMEALKLPQYITVREFDHAYSALELVFILLSALSKL